MKKAGLCLCLVSVLMLSSCKSWWSNEDEDDNPFKGVKVETLYNESNKYLKQKEYSKAIDRLEAMETMYPFNQYAEKAHRNLIYAYYEKEDFPSAAASAERYIHLYPRSAHVDYAYYMKGLANFQQPRGPLTKILSFDDSWRDPGTQFQAYSDFASLVERYPNSQYKNNALQRMIYLRNLFAQRELNVAKFYFKRQMYVAAVDRANDVISTYQQSPSAKEALVIMYKSNKKLGLQDAANQAKVVYQNTYHKEI